MSASEHEEVQEGVVRKSLSLSADLFAQIDRLCVGTGESFSGVVRMLVKIGLHAREQGMLGEEQDMVVLKKPMSGWVIQLATKLDMSPESLLLKIVTEGLSKYTEQAQSYRQLKEKLKEVFNEGGGTRARHS